MRLALSCAALLALAAPVAAQSNAERVVNDAYTRSHDYDLVHQRIEVRNFDWDSTSLDGRVTTTLVALRPGLDSVILDAGKRLVVSRVVDARGATLRSSAHGDTLVVYPGRPVAFRDTLRFSIDYHARIDNGRGLTFIEPEGREHRPQQIWSQGEDQDRKSTRLNSSHLGISYAVFCLKKKNDYNMITGRHNIHAPDIVLASLTQCT